MPPQFQNQSEGSQIPQQNQNPVNEEHPHGPRSVMYFVLAILLTIVTLGGVYFYVREVSENTNVDPLVITPAEKPNSTSTSTPTIKGTGQFCGGIAAIQCPTGYECRLDGTYPDAGGKCELSP